MGMDGLPNDFDDFSPEDELCCTFYEEDEREMKGEIEEGPETFSEGAKMRAVHPVEVEHVDEVLEYR